jgi:hypothetical protein
MGDPDAAGVGEGVGATDGDINGVIVGVLVDTWELVGTGVAVAMPDGATLGDGVGVKFEVVVAVGVEMEPAGCGTRATNAPMFGEAVPAVAVCPVTVPDEFKSRSASPIPTPPLLAPRVHRGSTGDGRLMLVALATENNDTSRSPLSPAGTPNDGVVMEVELAFPCPLLASTG